MKYSYEILNLLNATNTCLFTIGSSPNQRTTIKIMKEHIENLLTQLWNLGYNLFLYLSQFDFIYSWEYDYVMCQVVIKFRGC